MTDAPRRLSIPNEYGWKMPPNEIYVGWGSSWENRFKVGAWSNTLGRTIETKEDAIDLYRRLVWSQPHMAYWARQQLRGHDLTCWCRIGEPCEGDVLLEIANG